MYLQDGKSSCGGASGCNAIEAVGGHPLPQDAFFRLAGGDAGGVGPAGIIKAIRGLGHGAAPVKWRTRHTAMAGLRRLILAGDAAILLVTTDDPGDHWVTATGIIGRRFNVVDPAAAEMLVVRDPDELDAWWRLPRSPHYYAIRVWLDGKEAR